MRIDVPAYDAKRRRLLKRIARYKQERKEQERANQAQAREAADREFLAGVVARIDQALAAATGAPGG